MFHNFEECSNSKRVLYIGISQENYINKTEVIWCSDITVPQYCMVLRCGALTNGMNHEENMFEWNRSMRPYRKINNRSTTNQNAVRNTCNDTYRIAKCNDSPINVVLMRIKLGC